MQFKYGVMEGKHIFGFLTRALAKNAHAELTIFSQLFPKQTLFTSICLAFSRIGLIVLTLLTLYALGTASINLWGNALSLVCFATAIFINCFLCMIVAMNSQSIKLFKRSKNEEEQNASDIS